MTVCSIPRATRHLVRFALGTRYSCSWEVKQATNQQTISRNTPLCWCSVMHFVELFELPVVQGERRLSLLLFFFFFFFFFFPLASVTVQVYCPLTTWNTERNEFLLFCLFVCNLSFVAVVFGVLFLPFCVANSFRVLFCEKYVSMIILKHVNDVSVVTSLPW